MRNLRTATVAAILIVTVVVAITAWRRQSSPPVKSRYEALIRQVVLNNMWRSGSPMECLAEHMRQGLNYRQALDACEIPLTGDEPGATLPGGLPDFPTVVPAGSPTPTTAACASLPSRSGFGAPRADAGTDDEDLPPLPQPTTLSTLVNAMREMGTLAKALKDSGASPDAYLPVYRAAVTLSDYVMDEVNRQRGRTGGNRTVQGIESPCQQVNAFFAQCEASNWASSDCRAILEALDKCANSEVSLTNGESTCKPVDPGLKEASALIEIECSKLARGADGKHPCDRELPKEVTVTAAQVVMERCKPQKNDDEIPQDPGKPWCKPADIERFLSMALPPKDFSFITSKIGGPRPPSGTDPIPR